MSIDWYVKFSGKANPEFGSVYPTPDEVSMVVEDFLGPVLTEWGRDETGSWWNFRLGDRSPRSALARTFSPEMAKAMHLDPDDRYKEVMGWNNGRWFQIFYPPDHSQFAIILRHQQDEFVHAVADGLASVFARRWKGTVRRPS